MPEITLRHEIDCDEDTYWNDCFFDPAYNRELYEKTLGFPRYEMLDNRDEGERRVRRTKIDPPLAGVPGPVKKIIGDRFSYVEEGVFDKKTRRYTFKVTPSAMADRSSTSGEMFCEKLGEGKIARVARVRVEVRVPLVGGKLEEKILGDMRHSYAEAARFASGWVKERRPAGA